MVAVAVFKIACIHTESWYLSTTNIIITSLRLEQRRIYCSYPCVCPPTGSVDKKDYVNKVAGERIAGKRTNDCSAATPISSKNKKIW